MWNIKEEEKRERIRKAAVTTGMMLYIIQPDKRCREHSRLSG